ncbi:hypothetical protein DPMN_097011 [Dreissena polymorpha]|uniref:Uncharacterized protein n=1 Tax=Dreissena polymorpha TaxID=45954 RepID=A0A9D4LAW2_DREPO|nr:hypothetical protein DPMN_097011 [Dreissena polymorpha]
MNNKWPHGGNVFQQTGTIFELVQDIIGTNLLTKFHEDPTINVALQGAPGLVMGPCIVEIDVNRFNFGWALPMWAGHPRIYCIVIREVQYQFEVNRCRNEEIIVKGNFVEIDRIVIREVQYQFEDNHCKNEEIIFQGSSANRRTDITTISPLFLRKAWKITRLLQKTSPTPGGHVFPPIMTIFYLIQDIIGMNLLTKKNAPPLGSHVFKTKVTIFEFIQDIIGTNLLSKFHEDRKINVASRVLTRKNAPPPGGHVLQPTSIIFKLVQNIIEMNLLTKFHEAQTINVASRPYKEKCPPLGSHVFQANVTIFELIQDIVETNLLTKFHEDWTINVASRELTRQMCHIRKNAPTPGSHVFQPTGIIFELVQDINGMNLLTKFHKDWTINVTSRVKNAPPLGSHVFQAKVTIFELIQDIIGTNLLSKFDEDRKINVTFTVLTRKNALPPGGYFFMKIRQLMWPLDSRVKNAPPLGSHVFQANVSIFELIQDIIETNLLTKFHEDWTINVASRELTSLMLTPHNGRRTKGDHKSSP